MISWYTQLFVNKVKSANLLLTQHKSKILVTAMGVVNYPHHKSPKWMFFGWRIFIIVIWLLLNSYLNLLYSSPVRRTLASWSRINARITILTISVLTLQIGDHSVHGCLRTVNLVAWLVSSWESGGAVAHGSPARIWGDSVERQLERCELFFKYKTRIRRYPVREKRKSPL